MDEITLFLNLLWGTVIHRPYVYAFLVCFLFFSIRHLRMSGTLFYLILAYCVAFICEFSSTRNGFPFGRYFYLDETRVRELWISNVPFWDSLSFVFLSYFSWIVAASVRHPAAPNSVLYESRTALLAGFLMMMLDVVIDPLTLLGERWFLGKIYYYESPGLYFGIPLSNFLGWWFVGTLTLFLFGKLSRRWDRTLTRLDQWGAFGVYTGVFVFNLGITVWIQEWLLLSVSTFIATSVIFLCYKSYSRRSILETQ